MTGRHLQSSVADLGSSWLSDGGDIAKRISGSTGRSSATLRPGRAKQFTDVRRQYGRALEGIEQSAVGAPITVLAALSSAPDKARYRRALRSSCRVVGSGLKWVLNPDGTVVGLIAVGLVADENEIRRGNRLAACLKRLPNPV